MYLLWREQKTKLNLFVKSLITGNSSCLVGRGVLALPVFPVLRKQRLKDYKFKASLDYIENPWLKTNKNIYGNVHHR